MPSHVDTPRPAPQSSASTSIVGRLRPLLSVAGILVTAGFVGTSMLLPRADLDVAQAALASEAATVDGQSITASGDMVVGAREDYAGAEIPEPEPEPEPTQEIASSANSGSSSGGSSSGGSSSGGSSSSAPAPVAATPDPGSAKAIAAQLVAARGWGTGEYNCLVSLWTKESGWNVSASNPSSGAYGIPQALPGSKMASAGADWQTNPATQITWGLGYIQGRYGSPCGAWNHSQINNWY